MENEVLNSQPTVVESNATDTNVATNTVDDTNVGEPTVVEQPTPMDNNVTYNNVPKIEVDPNKDLTQNVIQNAITVEHNNNVSMNAGSAMDNFLNNEYDYDKNEAGTYWVAGAINDVNTQMSFLNAIINEEMYDEMDLQKYYYDTTMATARAYAASKEKETAYGFYRAAQEKAIAEASLTGWYMPAEGQYMLGQYTVAQNVLEDPNADDESRNKATRISNTVQKWFNANQISTRGIKCLTMMNYEENVRHNTIMGELQKEANKIAAQGAASSGAASDLQLREFKFQVEEMEMQYGYNFSKDIGLDNKDYLGHDISTDPEYIKYQALGGADTLEGLLKNPNYFAAVLGARNTEWIKQSLGEDNYESLYNRYRGDLGDKILKDTNGNTLDETNLDTLKGSSNKVSASDKNYGNYSDRTIYTFTSSEGETGVTRCYVKDNNGVFHQITSDDIKLNDNKYLSDVVKNFSGKQLTYNGKNINVGSKMDITKLEGSYTNNKDMYKGLSSKQLKTVSKKEAEGYHVEKGFYSVDKINADVVMSIGEGEDKKYYEVSNVTGDFKQIDKPKNVRKLSVNAKEGEVFYVESNSKLKNGLYKTNSFKEEDLEGNSHSAIARQSAMINQAATIGKDDKGNDILAYVNADGSTTLLRKENKKVEAANGSQVDGTVYTVVDSNVLNEKDLEAFKTNTENYANTYVPTVKGKNASTLEEEQKEKNDKEGTVDLTISGSSGSAGSSGYEAQDTVEKKNINYNRFESAEEEKENPEFLNGLGSYEEIKNRKNINQIKA